MTRRWDTGLGRRNVEMCCRSRLHPYPKEWRLIIAIAGFGSPGGGGGFVRRIGESAIFVSESPPHALHFRLVPSIQSHDLASHRFNAQAAAVLFKTMMTLAERSAGTIVQEALIGDCYTENKVQERILAEYPQKPLLFENLCWGFRAVLGSGVPQLGGDDELPEV